MPGATLQIDFLSRTMITLFDEKQVIHLPTAGQSVFGDPENGGVTVITPSSEAVDIPVSRGNERTAALIPRGQVSRFIGTLGATKPAADTQFGQETIFSRFLPLAEERFNITGDVINKRTIDEGIYEGATPEVRFRKLAIRGHLENMRRHIRLDEYLAWQSLITAKQPRILGNTTDVFDWRRVTTNIVTPTFAWSNASGVPLTDIDGACDKVRSKGKIQADAIVMGGATFQNFVTNPQVTAYFNKFYFNLATLSYDYNADGRYNKLIAGGMVARGVIQTPKGYKLVVFTYLEGFENDSGVFTQYMPLNSALIFSTRARCDRYYGPGQRLPMTPNKAMDFAYRMGFNPGTPMMPQNIEVDTSTVIIPATFFPYISESEDGNKATIYTQHSALFPTTQTDAFVTLNGL